MKKLSAKKLNITTNILIISFYLISMNCTMAQQNSKTSFLVDTIYAVKPFPEWVFTEHFYDSDNKILKSITTGETFEQGKLRPLKSMELFEYENGRVSKKKYTDSTHLLCNSCDEHYFYNSQGQLIRSEYYNNGIFNGHIKYHYENGLMVSIYSDDTLPFQGDTIFYDTSGNVVKRSTYIGNNKWRIYYYEYDNNPKPSFGIDYLFLYPPPPAEGNIPANLAKGLSKNNMTRAVTEHETYNYIYNDFGLPEAIESIFEPIGEGGTIIIKYKQIEVSVSEPSKELSEIRVYPNPTDGELRIENGELKIENVEIYDVYGRKVLEPPLTVLRSYDLTVLPAGIYFLKIATDKGGVVKKVVKH